MHKPGVNEDQAHDLRAGIQPDTRKRPRIALRCLAVSSGKGGVGKTMLSIGLSTCLARMGYRVLLLDADLGLANVDIQMGLEPSLTLQDVVFGRASMEAAVMAVDRGPDVLPGVSGAPELVDMGSARRDLLVNQLVAFAAGYDYLIIDAGAGIGSPVTAFLKAAPEVLVVMVNEPTSLMDAYAVIKTLSREHPAPSLSVVVNQARSFEDGEVVVERLNRITGKFLGIQLPLAGIVLQDPVVGDAVRRRRPVLDYAEQSSVAHCLADIARYVVQHPVALLDGDRVEAVMGRLFESPSDGGAGT